MEAGLPGVHGPSAGQSARKEGQGRAQIPLLLTGARPVTGKHSRKFSAPMVAQVSEGWHKYIIIIMCFNLL